MFYDRNCPESYDQIFSCLYFSIKLQLMGYAVLYRNDPKFSDLQFWANSADPDQTAPRRPV